MTQELTFKHRGPSDIRAGKKAATAIVAESSGDDSSSGDPGSERYGAIEANSDVEPSSSEAEESEPTSDKKVGLRKPSKKVLETAMNEVRAVGDYCG